MRGLSAWIRSQVNPIRSSAPGAKFSTSTSQRFTRRSSTCLPLALLASRVMERLLWFNMEVETVHVGNVAQLLAGDVAAPRPFHLDDVGAQPGEQLGTGGPRLNVREVENTHAV